MEGQTMKAVTTNQGLTKVRRQVARVTQVLTIASDVFSYSDTQTKQD